MSNKDDEQTAYYAAVVNAWLSTKFELDKSLLTLSSGAIGLLVTLLTTVGATSIEGLMLYFAALLSFLVCLISILCIFKRNAKYLEAITNSTGKSDSVLVSLDKIAAVSFVFGVILALLIGGSSAINEFVGKQVKMTKKTNESTRTIALESLNNLHKFNPEKSVKSSVEGIQNMAPPQTKPDKTKTED